MKQDLKPGVGYCALAPDDYATARAALNSECKLIRKHARIVLENAGVALAG